MNKKSQITLFIIIGIIIIGVLSYVFLSKQKAVEDPLAALQEEAAKISKSDSLKFYVESFIEQATKDAVKLVGVQGGYIYDWQSSGTVAFLGPGGILCSYLPSTECKSGKNIILYETYPFEIDNVSYAIKAPERGYTLPPEYPYRGSLQKQDKLSTFGNVVGGEKEGSIIELCYANGPNNRSLSGAQHSCFDSYSTSGRSIQSFLERYIENKTISCANFEDVDSFKGVAISPKNISAEVLIGDTDLVVSVNYDLQLDFEGSSAKNNKAVRTIAEFSYQMHNMRLKHIYELAYHLAQRESSSIFFDAASRQDLSTLILCTDSENPLLKVPCLKEGMSVKRIANPCEDCSVNKYSDVIQIKDEQSLIDTAPYVFQFAIANRPPALDFIDKGVQPEAFYYTYLASQAKLGTLHKRSLDYASEDGYNIIVGFQDSLEIYPYAIDPDDSEVFFNYIQLGEDNFGDRLARSSLFETSHINSEISLTSDDLGVHKFRLNVGDNEGYSDWQDIVLMVCNSKSNCESCASCTVTDPDDPDYCLDGCVSPRDKDLCCS